MHRRGRERTPGYGLAMACIVVWMLMAAGHVAEQPVRAAPGAVARAASLLPPRTININTAGAAEFRLLPAIGAVLAERIEQDRDANGPFASINDLQRVRGIGAKVLERIRPGVRVE